MLALRARLVLEGHAAGQRPGDRLERLGADRNPDHDTASNRARVLTTIGLCDLLDRFSYDCLWRAEARSKKGKSACGVYLPDLAQPRPPDLLPGSYDCAS
jgi:hypothetical protein